jgi:CRP-like cAMP-binding protein
MFSRESSRKTLYWKKTDGAQSEEKPMLDIKTIGDVEVFKDLGYAQLKTVLEYCDEVEYQPGDTIFDAGDDSLFLYAVLEGNVDLHWELPGRSVLPEDAVTTLQPGDTFGWSSLVPPRSYSLSAVCSQSSCRALRVDASGFLDLFEKDKEVGCRVMARVLAVVSARFLALQDEIARRRGSDIMNQW